MAASFFLTGCGSSYSLKEAAQLATRQTNSISQQLPIKDGPYTFILAQRVKNAVNLVFIYEDDNDGSHSPKKFSDAYLHLMCADPTVRALINKGVVYKVKVNSVQSTMLNELQIDNQSCSLAVT